MEKVDYFLKQDYTRLASHDTAETDLRDFEKAQHMLGETLLV